MHSVQVLKVQDWSELWGPCAESIGHGDASLTMQVLVGGVSASLLRGPKPQAK